MKNNQDVSICCDLNVFDGRLNYLRSASLLLTILVFLRDVKTNKVQLTYSDGEEILKEKYKKVTQRTVRNWLRRLGQNGAIKRTYTGEIIINPFYVFEGSKQEHEACIESWNNFKGVDVLIENNVTST